MILFSYFVRYLIEHGANVAAVNNDGELPLDIAESDEMEDMLQQHVDEQGNSYLISSVKLDFKILWKQIC